MDVLKNSEMTRSNRYAAACLYGCARDIPFRRPPSVSSAGYWATSPKGFSTISDSLLGSEGRSGQ